MNLNVLRFNIAINDLDEVSDDLVFSIAGESGIDGFFKCLFNGRETLKEISPTQQRKEYYKELLNKCNLLTEANLSDTFLELCAFYWLPRLALQDFTSLEYIKQEVIEYELLIDYTPQNDIEWFILECVKYKLLDYYIVLTRLQESENYQKLKSLTQELTDNQNKYKEMTNLTCEKYIIQG